MKTPKLLVLLTVLLFPALAKGQAALLVLIFGEKAATENFYFSLKGGLNYSMVSGTEDGSNRLGANFGLVNNIRLSEQYYLTPEFLALSHRGIRDQEVITTGNPELDSLLRSPTRTDRKLSYVDIPILLRRNLGDRWSISAGPQISILSSATDIYYSEPVSEIVLQTEVDIRDKLASLDLSAVLDLSFRISDPKGGKGMILYLRFSRGFININRNTDRDPAFHHTLQFGASFPFIKETNEP